jgi:hypothetical protein
VAGQRFTGLGQVFYKHWVMPLDDLEEQCALWPVALISNTIHFETVRPRRFGQAKTAGWPTAGRMSVSKWLFYMATHSRKTSPSKAGLTLLRDA